MRRYKFLGNPPGSGGAVDVPALGMVDLAPGTVVEVEDPTVADGLDGQASWEHIPDPKRSKAAKQAAESRADDDSQEG